MEQGNVGTYKLLAEVQTRTILFISIRKAGFIVK